MTREEFYSKWCPLLDTVAERDPAFIVRAAEAKLRDALDLANQRLLRYQDENVRLTRENVTLRRKLGEAEVARDAALDAWVVAAGERDLLDLRYRALFEATS